MLEVHEVGGIAAGVASVVDEPELLEAADGSLGRFGGVVAPELFDQLAAAVVAIADQPHRLVLTALAVGVDDAGVQLLVGDLAPDVEAVAEDGLGVELHRFFAVDI